MWHQRLRPLPGENTTRWGLAETKDRYGLCEAFTSLSLFLSLSTTSFSQRPAATPAPSLTSPAIPRTLLNRIPNYDVNTTFDDPAVHVEVRERSEPRPSLRHQHRTIFPSMLSREAGESFSEGQLKDRDTATVWVDAKKLYSDKITRLPEALRTTRS
ncbi:hypothetical protein V8C37DRAFT_399083 [Trichoderma ceciliae]